MERLCEVCKAYRAVVYCIADAASLCLTCDAKVHSANALSGRHLRTLLCGFCKNQPCVVRCLDHKMFLCNGCNDKIHGVVSSKHVRHDVRCYTGCPSAKDFAVMWGFRVMDNDVSLEKSFAMAKPKVWCLFLYIFKMNRSLCMLMYRWFLGAKRSWFCVGTDSWIGEASAQGRE